MGIGIFGAEDILQIQQGKHKENRGVYKKQITEDIMADKMNMKEYIDPFTGEPVGKKQ